MDLAINLSSLFVPKDSVIMSVKLANGQTRTYKNNTNPTVIRLIILLIHLP